MPDDLKMNLKHAVALLPAIALLNAMRRQGGASSNPTHNAALVDEWAQEAKVILEDLER